MTNTPLDNGLKDAIKSMRLCRASIVLIISAIFLGASYFNLGVGITLLIVALFFGNLVITKKYKSKTVSLISKHLVQSPPISHPSLTQYDIINAGTFSYEDFFVLKSGNTTASFAEFKVMRHMGRYRYKSFSGKLYFCELGFETGNTVLMFTPGWEKRPQGQKVAIDGASSLQCQTTNGELNGELSKLIGQKIMPGLSTMMLLPSAIIIDGSRLCIVEDDSIDNFDVNIFSNFSKKIGYDSKTVDRIAANLETMCQTVSSLEPIAIDPQASNLSWIPSASMPPAPATERKEEAIAPAAEKPAASIATTQQVSEIMEKMGFMKKLPIYFNVISAVGLFLLSALFIGYKYLHYETSHWILFAAIALIPVALCRNLFAKLIWTKCVGRMAQAIFGSKASACSKGQEIIVNASGATIKSMSSAGRSSSTIILSNILDDSGIRKKADEVMHSVSRYASYSVSSDDSGTTTIAAGGIGFGIPNRICEQALRNAVHNMLVINEIVS